jgi:hypothetical protein
MPRGLRSSCGVSGTINGMNGTPGQGPRNVVAREIGGWRRAALAAVGLMSWLAGGAAAFLSKNGAGAAALVAAGTVCGVLALMDRWPSRISMKVVLVDCLIYRGLLRHQRRHAAASPDCDEPITTRMKMAH